MQNISISYLLDLAIKRIWILLLTAIVFAVSAFSYSKLVLVPTYSATASIFVTNGNIFYQGDNNKSDMDSTSNTDDSINGSDIWSSIALAKNVVELLKSPNKYINLAEKLGDGYNYSSLMNKANISLHEQDTLFVDIRFLSTNGNEAVRLANAFAELACEEIPKDIKNSNVSLVSTALEYKKVAPNEIQNTIIATVVGLLLAYSAILVIDMLDQSIRGEEEYIERYDVPLIGSVPDFEGISYNNYGKYKYSYGKKGGYYGGN